MGRPVAIALLLLLAHAGCERDGEPATQRRAALELDGCWRIDHDRMLASNRIPRGLAPTNFRDWIEGYGVQFAPGSVHQWLVVDGTTYFDRHDPVTQEREGEQIRLRAAWSEPPPTPAGTPPPARFHPEVTFAADGADRVLARPNFVLKSAWGIDTGALPLQRIRCR